MGAITVINVFTPKTGRVEEFVSVQKATLPAVRSQVPGVLASRFYRSVDGNTALLSTTFESAQHFDDFRKSEVFASHREKLTPLLERTDPNLYELVYEAGTV